MSDKKLLVKAVLFGTVCGLMVSIILLCICTSVILSIGLLPTDITNYIMLAILSAGAFFGGFICARITKSAGLVVGMVTGFTIFLLVTIIGIIKSTDAVSAVTLIRFVLTVIIGGSGGIIGVNKKEKLKIK